MYYIYHIKGIKIGVSTNPELRVKRQGYSEFEILETHTCIDIVSQREMELQKKYGYPVDSIPYKQSYAWCKSGYRKGGIVAGNKQKEFFKKIASKYAVENSLKSRYKLQKKVYQYDLEYNLIKIFDGRNLVKKELGYCVGANLTKRTKSCHGFIFSYEPLTKSTSTVRSSIESHL